MGDVGKPAPVFGDDATLPAGGSGRATPRLLVIGPDEPLSFPLEEPGTYTLGRSSEADIALADPALSRFHAAITYTPEADPPLSVRDLGSSNGTRLRSRPLVPGVEAPFRPGDPIEIGRSTLIVQKSEPPAEARHGRARPGVRPGLGPTATAELDSDPAVVIADPAMQSLYALAERIANKDLSVLILGETGVGKEILARAVHRSSRRANRPFIALNCGAFSEELLDSELFGHQRGAFTGAVKDKPGLLETADGGTLFLDEVGELSLETQVKLLRVLEERRLRRVGGLEPIAFDARFVAATNRDLEAAVRGGRFREDLYYRLNGITLVIPPLRERPTEILPLARSFAALALERDGLAGAPRFTATAEAALLEFAWPGNVRELRNVVERAVALASGPLIDVLHLGLDRELRAAAARRVPAPAAVPAPAPAPAPLRDQEREPAETLPGEPQPDHRAEMASVERAAILDALERSGGNQTRAAELLGMSRKSLVRRLDSYQLPRPRKGRP
jgi:DNA-binding NtrC family response regulator